MLNKVILIGKIFGDPELRYFKNNNVITIIKLITFENNDEGEKQNSWHRIIINKKYTGLKKNMIILVMGKIKTRRWVKNNKYNYITEIISEDIQIINKDLGKEDNNVLENENNKYYNIEEKENQENHLENYNNNENEIEKIENDEKIELNRNEMIYDDDYDYNNEY
ncbi:hypothetical protein NDNC_0840 [Candidatus Nasuia deltocephalinicola]|uniref:Single-stranded DNA-binding protein n=1 Tax=Candidatus Nasuia deltocephalincola TaxID=1160784 RepID=A0A974WLM1_9PROT|nr:hypothetical protein CU086_00150 [Candidatus Nasuia deltocephalinicola]WKD87147.1 single-stranded DNA-binding protein [Candidatus Nasuia deltocephalinicola]BEH03918.1 hypothetical protein NDNC_0840 [Candidatus Nasuia deltocephalinicola]